MSQCVPSWGLDDSPPPAKLALRSNSLATNVPSMDYEVAELTWENGQLAMHGLGHKPTSPTIKYTWDNNKPSGGGTLESIVDQATHHHRKSAADGSSDELVPWLDNRHAKIKTAAAGNDASVGNNKTIINADALVPCSNNTGNYSEQRDGNGKCFVASSTYVGSCSGAVNGRTPRAETGAAHEWSSMGADQSVSGSATTCGGRDSRQLTVEYSSERDLGSGRFTSTSMGSPENTSSAKTVDDHDTVCRKRSQRDQAGNEEDKKKRCKKSSVSTKRSRAAATHNQSERKRRDKINQRMKTLQKMVPNSSKTDKASMLDEVIEYLKQLQSQVEMMNRMNMSPMMMPNMAMQQQLQMLMMAPMGMRLGMGMGMGMGGGMDINNLGCHNVTGMPPFLHPNTTAFMPMTSWDRSGDRISSATPADPLAAFLACQSQPMTMDAYSRIAALYQHYLQPPTSGHHGPKN